METYELEKWIWTDADFERMGWHDASIYGMRFTDGELAFDIDYIFKWNQPEVEGFHFTFYVAPCTLIFHNVCNLNFELIQTYGFQIEISDIEREEREGQFHYTILCQEGNLSFTASAYTQTVRMLPSFQLGQQVPYDERGGMSFTTTTHNELDKEIRERVDERRKKEYEHYTWAKERHLLKQEITALQDKRDANEIPLKDFIKEKNYKRDKLAYYNIILRGTRYDSDNS